MTKRGPMAKLHRREEAHRRQHTMAWQKTRFLRSLGLPVPSIRGQALPFLQH